MCKVKIIALVVLCSILFLAFESGAAVMNRAILEQGSQLTDIPAPIPSSAKLQDPEEGSAVLIGYMKTARGKVAVTVVDSSYVDDLIAFASKDSHAASGYQIFISAKFLNAASAASISSEVIAFVLYHELGHIVNDDQGRFHRKAVRDPFRMELSADRFAVKRLKERGISGEYVNAIFLKIAHIAAELGEITNEDKDIFQKRMAMVSTKLQQGF